MSSVVMMILSFFSFVFGSWKEGLIFKIGVVCNFDSNLESQCNIVKVFNNDEN